MIRSNVACSPAITIQPSVAFPKVSRWDIQPEAVKNAFTRFIGQPAFSTELTPEPDRSGNYKDVQNRTKEQD